MTRKEAAAKVLKIIDRHISQTDKERESIPKEVFLSELLELREEMEALKEGEQE